MCNSSYFEYFVRSKRMFPRAKIVGGVYDFSFSGLKSAVLNYLNGEI